MDTKQNLEVNDSECLALYLEAMELSTKEITKINNARQRNDKEALRKIIQRHKTPQGMKFDPVKECDRCIKELHAVRFKKKTLYVYDPDEGYTSDLDLIRGCVAEVYRNEYVSISQQNEIIRHMKRYAPSVEEIEGIEKRSKD